MLHKRMIHTVIGLPDGLFSGSSTAASVMILNTVKPSDSIRFVKVTDEFTASGPEKRTELTKRPQLLSTVNNPMAIKIAVSEIVPDDCNLEVSRYLPDEEICKLSAALSIQPTNKLIDHGAIFIDQYIENPRHEAGGFH
ncbi:N-6 DNA methylase [Pseudomonas chlororaphis]|nr:N-6 DNA methylase [Pseudomonas chlororaphis]